MWTLTGCERSPASRPTHARSRARTHHRRLGRAHRGGDGRRSTRGAHRDPRRRRRDGVARLAAVHRGVVRDGVGARAARVAAAAADGAAVRGRAGRARDARAVELRDRRAVRDGRGAGRGRVARRVRVRARPRAAGVALVEAHRPPHAHARARGLARHGPRGGLRPARVLGDRAVVARRVRPRPLARAGIVGRLGR